MVNHFVRAEKRGTCRLCWLFIEHYTIRLLAKRNTESVRTHWITLDRWYELMKFQLWVLGGHTETGLSAILFNCLSVRTALITRVFRLVITYKMEISSFTEVWPSTSFLLPSCMAWHSVQTWIYIWLARHTTSNGTPVRLGWPRSWCSSKRAVLNFSCYFRSWVRGQVERQVSDGTYVGWVHHKSKKTDEYNCMH
jgi:hypothetical protein